MRGNRTFVVLLGALSLLAAMLVAPHQASGSPAAPGGAGRITPETVAKLKQKWVFTTAGDVADTPAVVNGIVYFTDFAGYVYAVREDTGALIWKGLTSEYTGQQYAITRNSPIIIGDELILGENFDNLKVFPVHDGVRVFALNRWTGKLIWKTKVDASAAAIITADPAVYGNNIYVGVSSMEEALATSASYPCCSFRGSVVSLNAYTGAINWKTYTIPQQLVRPCSATDCGFSGGAVWGTPAIDPATRSVVVGTGNNYTVPNAVVDCVEQAEKAGTSPDSCSPPEDYQETVLSMSLDTGAVKWSHRVSGYDAWIVTCPAQPVPWCPEKEGDDFDFGSRADVFPVVQHGEVHTAVGIGQKSGVYWAFDTRDGSLLWKTLVGPGTIDGGIMRGTKYDGKRIYVPINNFERIPYVLQPSGRQAAGGSWSALDPSTGRLLWQTADPGANTPFDNGPLEARNGVVYASSQESVGDNMYALDARSGRVLWSFASGGSVSAAPAVVGNSIYWGSGYTLAQVLFGGAANNKLYGFTL